MRVSLPAASRIPAFQRPRAWMWALMAIVMGAALAWLPSSSLLALGGAVCVILAAVAVLRAPVLGLGLALVAAPFGPLERELLNTPVDSSQIIFALALAGYAAQALASQPDWRRIRLRASPIMVMLGLWLGAGALSFFPSSDAGAWAREMLKWLEFALVMLIAGAEKAPWRRAALIGLALAGGLGQALFGLYQFGLRGDGPVHFAIVAGRLYRAYGSLQQPNPFGGLMGMLWPVALCLGAGLITNARRRRAWLAGGVMACGVAVACASGLVASWSRGAWLASAGAAAVMLVVWIRRPIQALGMLAGVLALLVALNLAGLLPEAVRDRLVGFTAQFAVQNIDVRYMDLNTGNFATIERLAHWQAAVDMIVDQPWLGVGLGNYATAYARYRTLYWENALGHAHNIYLNFAAETGVVGLAAYVALWAALIGRAARMALRGPRVGLPQMLALGVLGAVVHVSGHNLVDNLYVSNLWLVLGVFTGALQWVESPSCSN